MANMYWKTIVSLLTDRTPKIHVTPIIGLKITIFRTIDLRNKQKYEFNQSMNRLINQ